MTVAIHRHKLKLLSMPLCACADPDMPDTKLNPVDPLFPPGYVPGELTGVTLRSSEIFQAWAEITDDSRGGIIATPTGSTYTLRWGAKQKQTRAKGGAKEEAGAGTAPL